MGVAKGCAYCGLRACPLPILSSSHALRSSPEGPSVTLRNSDSHPRAGGWDPVPYPSRGVDPDAI
jgi:hypothetical protein